MNIISDMKTPVALFFIIGVVLGQSIIDFSHTDAIQQTITAQTTTYDVQIHPNSQKSDYLLYPGACTLQDTLSSHSVIEYEAYVLEEEQRNLVGLKQQIKQLLKISELIKTAKKNIEKSSLSSKGLSDLGIPLTSGDSAFGELQLLESELKSINVTIGNMVGNLSQLITYEINKTKNSNFDSIRLNFELKMNQARLQYLQYIKRRQPTDSSSLDPFKKALFGDIQEQISRERVELSKIDDLLEKFSDRERLKLERSNLQSQLDGINLMIKEKEACDERRYEKAHVQNRKELDRIIRELKQLKRTENQNHTYCEGVAPMLLQQLKKILKVYNYSFACSQGLPDLQQSKLILEQDLAKIKNQESLFDYDVRSQKLKKYFKDEDDMRTRLIDDIRVIKLSEFTLNPSTLNSEIALVKQRIKDISYQLEHPPETQNQAVAMDFDKIRAMISQIERQQNQYCKVKEEYLEKYRAQDIQVRAFQHRAAIYKDAQINQMARVNELRQLEISFQTLRSTIMRSLE